ncbi:hypothetical protein AA15669_1214 [Saccharibacter floricola DSM 15669]|uniref:Uncharacterized protein n=1 Tax=Saccharibacter floricola DSM 15669 TaxID=1123227 RepID=A0ABQ0NZD3_9PROT|nr:hypothetical protein AA15669_1214 [Saccharibacter floricola DSM 15669]
MVLGNEALRVRDGMKARTAPCADSILGASSSAIGYGTSDSTIRWWGEQAGLVWACAECQSTCLEWEGTAKVFACEATARLIGLGDKCFCQGAIIEVANPDKLEA